MSDLPNIQGIKAGSWNEVYIAQALADAGLEFEYQYDFNGGRSFRGGQVIDFVVYEGGQKTAIRVQGSHWHSKKEEAADTLEKIALEQSGRFLRVLDAQDEDHETMKAARRFIAENF